MLQLGCTAVVILSGCVAYSEAPVRSVLPPFLEMQAGLCRTTGGQWHGGWLHCLCPAESLFYVDRGCAEVPWSAGVTRLRRNPWVPIAKVRKALQTLLLPGSTTQITVDTQTLSARALRLWTRLLRENPAVLLRGMTLPPRGAQHLSVWMLSPPDATNRESIEHEVAMGPAQIVALDPFFAMSHGKTRGFGSPDLGALNVSWMDAAWWWGDVATVAAMRAQGTHFAPVAAALDAATCRRALAATRLDAATATTLCSAAQAAWQHLQDPVTSPWPLGPVRTGWRDAGDGCATECSLASQFIGADAAVYYSVVLVDGVPMRRVLRAGSPQGHELMVFMAPSANIDSIVVKTRHVAPVASAHVLLRERWLFNAQWATLRHDAQPVGHRAELERALVGWMGTNELPTDDDAREQAPTGSVRAVVIDTGVDPRLPGLRHRMALPYGTSLAEQILPFSSFTALGSGTLQALTLFDERGHGTRVAATLMADLPAARLHVLRGDDLGFVPVATLQERWLNFLMATQPHVVNISQDYGRLLPDCAAFFGPLVTALPHTLFVAGAGNDAAPSIRGVCPASLAAQYANVVAVAGSTARGEAFDALSNRGLEVSVAAPMRQTSVSFGTSEGSLSPTASEVVRADGYGTSFAAAATSNLALRQVAAAVQNDQVPALGADLAAALRAACTPTGLAVQCGGALLP